MPNPPDDPTDPGDVSPDWEGFALNVGLKLAETFGLGLTLFNAMRARFPDVAGSILGAITSTIGAAIRAVTGLTAAEYNQQIGSMELPFVPASWNEGAPGDRILGGVDVVGVDAAGNKQAVRRVWVNGLEQMSPADIVDEAQALFDAQLNETDPKVLDRIEKLQSQLFFLARRF